MRYFEEVDGLIGLEEQEKWEDARLLLYKTWESDKSCCDSLIRLFSECWYVLSLWDCSIDTDNISFQAFQNTLVECLEFGMQSCKDNPKFLCIAGYMISTLPYLFYTENSNITYNELEGKGKEMLYLATRLEPNNLIARILYVGTQGISEEYSKEKRKLSSMIINTVFEGDTAIEEYFKDILSIKSF